MTKDEWVRRFTAQIQEHCNLPADALVDIVEANWAARVEQGDMEDPEEAAMDELSCWEDDDPI